MKRTKAPVLTSPSKIGFFVSLMLVLVSIGVTYFFTRRFNITWNLLDRDWLNRNEWLGVLRGEGVLFELLPLIGLVAVMAMFAYLVITGAVRNYKRYLDSGHDYRNLLMSLKDLEGLEDKRKIERIKNHPELKRLLLGLVETFEERERLLAEREGALETRLQDVVVAKETELTDGFLEECNRLAAVLESGKVEPSALEFSNPGLLKLADLVGRAPARPAPAAEVRIGRAAAESERLTRTLRNRLQDTVEELQTARDAAQGIETRLRKMVGARSQDPGKPKLDAARREIRTVITSLSSLEQLNLTFDALSEEARGIAINTALHAGTGMGVQEDLIRLAEEVKEIAARFKEAVKRFAQTSSAMRASAGILDTIAGETASLSGSPSEPEEDLSSVLSRVSLWVERMVVLSEKVSNMARLDEIAASSLHDEEAEAAGADLETPVEKKTDEDEFGFETLDRQRALFSDSDEAAVEGVETSGPSGRPMFEEMSGSQIEAGAADDREELPVDAGAAADREELPVDAGVAEDREELPVDAGDAEDREELPVDAAVADDREELPVDAAVEEEQPSDAADARTAPRFDSPVEDLPDEEPVRETPDRRRARTVADHFPLDHDDETAEPEREAARAQAEPAAEEARVDRRGSVTGRDVASDAEAEETEEEPVDLYALGAVDYDPALHR